MRGAWRRDKVWVVWDKGWLDRGSGVCKEARVTCGIRISRRLSVKRLLFVLLLLLLPPRLLLLLVLPLHVAVVAQRNPGHLHHTLRVHIPLMPRLPPKPQQMRAVCHPVACADAVEHLAQPAEHAQRGVVEVRVVAVVPAANI